ncbi:MAG TPA: biopolymer transporter ExbD [Tepidisphaeraceae bacterium]|nr:biopolymer transporter ExbD [Tepidisphaeraceae bacterium]
MTARAFKAAHYDSGPNMTPLVDVVMVILIFLMLAGSFGAASHYLPGAIPKHTGAPGTEVAITDVTPIVVRMGSRGEGFVASSPDLGRDLATGQPRQYRSVEELQAALAAKRAEKHAAGTPAEQMQVMIAPEARAKYEHVLGVYEAAMAAEWPKIGFQAAR